MENWASTSNECRARGSSVSYELWLKKVFVLCLVLLSVQKLAWDYSAYKFMESWWCNTVKASIFVELHFSINPQLLRSSSKYLYISIFSLFFLSSECYPILFQFSCYDISGLMLWNQTREQWVGNKKRHSRSQQLRETKLRWASLWFHIVN